MNNVLVEFHREFTLMDIHANFSLSFLVGALENINGVILVSQPSIYDIEVYLDRNFVKTEVERRALRARISSVFEHINAKVDYVQNN